MKMTPMNVRMAPSDLKTIALLADKIHAKQSDVIRLALSIGLNSLQAVKKTQSELYQEEAMRIQAEPSLAESKRQPLSSVKHLPHDRASSA